MDPTTVASEGQVTIPKPIRQEKKSGHGHEEERACY
jgi:bifunctional DNA-binding transcriptional regulator/antitoxin component of YhaV-PrlF toxin-antitoxin module